MEGSGPKKSSQRLHFQLAGMKALLTEERSEIKCSGDPGGIKAGFSVTPEHGTTFLSHPLSTAAPACKYEGIMKMFQFKWSSLCTFRNIQK